MSDPLFTVVIPCYNRQHTVVRAIRSVRRQSYPHWKLLVVDDHSSDRTADRARRFVDGERIRLLELKENAGISGVMNEALQRIDTPYFVQLDSDDALHPRTLERLAEAIERADPNTALFYGNVKLMQKTKRGWRCVRYLRHRSFQDKYDFLQYLTYMLHPRCYRTQAVREKGGWETDDPFGGRVMEDRRMCLKMVESYPVYWIDKVLYYRRRHRSQLTRPASYWKRNVMRKRTIEHYLTRWGRRYEPVYGYRNGLLVIKKLVSNEKEGIE